MPHPCLPTSCQSQRISPSPLSPHTRSRFFLSHSCISSQTILFGLSPSQLSLPKSFLPRSHPQTLTHPWPFPSTTAVSLHDSPP